MLPGQILKQSGGNIVDGESRLRWQVLLAVTHASSIHYLHGLRQYVYSL